jgi:hypothetical protein
MVKENFKSIALEVIESNPTAKVIYVTEDGNGFIDKNNASSHMRRKKQDMVSFTREELIGEELEENEEAAAEETEEHEETTAADNKEELKETPGSETPEAEKEELKENKEVAPKKVAPKKAAPKKAAAKK